MTLLRMAPNYSQTHAPEKYPNPILLNVHADQNPYAPGSGLKPPHLVGRAKEIADFDLIVARTLRKNACRGMVLHGYRGVGKTVLLNAMRAQAERSGWLVARLEAQPTHVGSYTFAQHLAKELDRGCGDFKNGKTVTPALKIAFDSLASFVQGIGGSVTQIPGQPTGTKRQSGQLEVDLCALLWDIREVLKETGTAFALFVDEMQDLDGETLGAVLAAQHLAGQEAIPFYVFGAGLPSLPAILSRSRSYAERLFDFRHIDTLSHDASREALTVPAERLGVRMNEDAVEALVGESGKYPYFIQTYGQAVWNVAEERTITMKDAEAAIVIGRKSLDEGFYPARWDRASSAERQYLSAMAGLDQMECDCAVIADRCGSKASQLSGIRRSLIDKGMIFSPDRGVVSFTVPGMPSFIKRQEEELVLEG